jgi:hypothetical protein
MSALTANAFHILERTKLGQTMGRERLHSNIELAVNSYKTDVGMGD